MFPIDQFDLKLADHARKIRQINCFAWMRQNLTPKRKKRSS